MTFRRSSRGSAPMSKTCSHFRREYRKTHRRCTGSPGRRLAVFESFEEFPPSTTSRASMFLSVVGRCPLEDFFEKFSSQKRNSIFLAAAPHH
ncbi:Hypothetical protein, putative [Bodo saltans]|uniref:Uncharacterized protein n=1 Tax=Bodo saltans TaxID=75058 RepID=A0A0S4JRR2_BODSA|nr:Hypothetical protein, putative [Bodo saltans]|eukprot:CUG94200.1 Hypothetical protein, putative [Bodo saltans]